MSDYVSLTVGPTVNKYYTNLIFDSYDEWLCYCALLDVFSTEHDMRAFVALNSKGQTYLIQVRSGYAKQVLGTHDYYEFLKDRGYRWLVMFDCLVDMSIRADNDEASLSWYDRFVQPTGDVKAARLIELDKSRLKINEYVKRNFKHIGEEPLYGRLMPDDLYEVYSVPSMSAKLPSEYKWSLLDDCIYSLDARNLSNGTYYLNQNIRGNELITKLYIKKNASKKPMHVDDVNSALRSHKRRRL